jgi:hypothetical protein
MNMTCDLEGNIHLKPDGNDTEGVLVMRDGSIIEIWESHRRICRQVLTKADTLWNRRPAPSKFPH